MYTYDNLSLVFARYNRMVAIDHNRAKMPLCLVAARDFPKTAWLAIAERLMCSGLTNCVRGDSLQFLADRVNDALLRADAGYRWDIAHLPS